MLAQASKKAGTARNGALQDNAINRVATGEISGGGLFRGESRKEEDKGRIHRRSTSIPGEDEQASMRPSQQMLNLRNVRFLVSLIGHGTTDGQARCRRLLLRERLA